MSAQQTFLEVNQDGIEEYRISSESGIKSPNAIPEIKSPEDLHAVLPRLEALDENNPVMVPGYRFEEIRTKPAMSKYGQRMNRLMNGHPLLYFEPPELFRYAMPDDLVTYGFQGSRSKRIEFNKKVEAGELDEAIEMLPLFFQPFVDRARSTLLRSYEDGPDPGTEENGKIAEGWGDPRADQGYKSYYREIVENAKQANNSHVVPPVPVVRKSSEGTVVRRLRGSNIAMADICDATTFAFDNPVFPYYHIYAHQNILREGQAHVQDLYEALQTDLDAHNFGGVVLTLTGYETIWENGIQDSLFDFVDRITDIAKRYSMPVHLPRSNWFGAALTDVGVNGFGFLLNGKETYPQGGGGMDGNNPHYQYGSIAIYDLSVDPLLDVYENFLANNGGQAHPISGLPNQPPKYNPRGSTYKEKFGKPRDFRIDFGKPRRLLHAQEAREFRKGIKNGLKNPARRYLERSQHPHLS